MRKEYIAFGRENINIGLARIRSYPLSWQDSTRILFVLKGSIVVGMENEHYLLREGYIEIINQNEIYSIDSRGQDNMVLIIDICPSFLEAFREEDYPIYYYTNTLAHSQQDDHRYLRLRQYLAALYYEGLKKTRDYEVRLDKVLSETIYHLLNNFHYLFYEEESLKEDDLQLDRFTRIINYIKTNYYKRVSLKEIAESEYLTPQYLSYKIKDTFGQGFNDFLNRIRVEESRKLLLNSKMSISEIALESGFSHIRYYDKHFRKIYGRGPASYRKKYRLEADEIRRLRDMDNLDLGLALEYLRPYLVQYSGYRTRRSSLAWSVDLLGQPIKKLARLRTLFVADHRDILQQDDSFLRSLARDLGYRKINLMDLDQIDNLRLEEIKSRLKGLGYSLVEGQAPSFEEGYPYLMEGVFKHLELFKKDRPRPVLLMPEDRSRLFSPSLSLLNSAGLKNSLYYLQLFLGLMGDIIYEDDRLLVSRSKEGYEILAHNSDRSSYDCSLRLSNLKRDYIASCYLLSREQGSIYHIDKTYGGLLRAKEFEYRDLARPGYSLSHLSRANLIKLDFRLDAYSLVFYRLV